MPCLLLLEGDLHDRKLSFPLASPSIEFNAQTNFVNASNSVMRDFQNTHHVTRFSGDLAELTNLISASRDISESQREIVRQEVAEIESDLADSERNDAAVQSKLERLAGGLAKVADIAAPATEIISKVMGMLGE